MFLIQEVIRAHLDNCLRLSSIDEVVSSFSKQVNKITLLKILSVK